MSGGPLLSVVVPFYNVQDYIGACLESLRVQTLTDLEVILVDDGSRDGSLAVAEAYVARDPRFRLVRQDNAGLGPARNTGTGWASGRYLTFVDSDDLVAPRAYSRLVGSLEATGSDFAAGNAYRFSTARGAYQSWTHEIPFASTRPATTIDAFPELIRDRMVWNKVYRRSFWDAAGLTFPAIRYEDYPVTLPGYLRARSVDVLADHVYYWRDRESGDSITQQTFRLDNVRDRVASALLVLDGLDAAEGHAEVRTRVHAYLIDVDLVALAEALLAAPADDRAALTELATGLADRLDPDADRLATPLAAQLHRSLRAGDLAMVRTLAHRRGGAGVRTLLTDVAAMLPRGLTRLPALARAVAPRNRPAHPLRRRLRSTLTGAAWQGDTLHLTVDSRLRGRWAARVTPRATLRTGSGSLDVPAQVSRPGDGLRWAIDVPPAVLDRVGETTAGATTAAIDPPESRAVLTLRLRAGIVRWAGDVRFGAAALPAARRRPAGDLVGLGGDAPGPAPENSGRDLAVLRWPGQPGSGDPGSGHSGSGYPVVTAVTVRGDEFVLRLAEVAPAGTRLVVERPDPTPDITVRPDGRDVRLSAGALVEGDPPDDPVTGVAERAVALLRPDRPAVPVLLAGDGARAVVAERSVELAVGRTGHLVVRQRRR